jgi:hypothetical protein
MTVALLVISVVGYAGLPHFRFVPDLSAGVIVGLCGRRVWWLVSPFRTLPVFFFIFPGRTPFIQHPPCNRRCQ